MEHGKDNDYSLQKRQKAVAKTADFISFLPYEENE
jgi:hypothetical protein